MNYYTISKPANDSFIEKRSEFIGYIAPVKTNDEAVDFINSIKAMHRKAVLFVHTLMQLHLPATQLIS